MNDQPQPRPEGLSLRRKVRLALDAIFRTEADFLAFVGDNFAQSRSDMGDGIDRVQKTNRLLEQEGADAVVAKLRSEHPELLAKYERDHGPLVADPITDRVRRSPLSLVLGIVVVAGLSGAVASSLWRVGHQPERPDRNPNPPVQKPERTRIVPLDMTMLPQVLAGQLFKPGGKPCLEGIRVVVYPSGVEGQTNKDGWFRLEVPGKPEESVTLHIDLGAGRVYDYPFTLPNTNAGVPIQPPC